MKLFDKSDAQQKQQPAQEMTHLELASLKEALAKERDAHHETLLLLAQTSEALELERRARAMPKTEDRQATQGTVEALRLRIQQLENDVQREKRAHEADILKERQASQELQRRLAPRNEPQTPARRLPANVEKSPAIRSWPGPDLAKLRARFEREQQAHPLTKRMPEGQAETVHGISLERAPQNTNQESEKGIKDKLELNAPALPKGLDQQKLRDPRKDSSAGVPRGQSDPAPQSRFFRQPIVIFKYDQTTDGRLGAYSFIPKFYALAGGPQFKFSVVKEDGIAGMFPTMFELQLNLAGTPAVFEKRRMVAKGAPRNLSRPSDVILAETGQEFLVGLTPESPRYVACVTNLAYAREKGVPDGTCINKLEIQVFQDG